MMVTAENVARKNQQNEQYLGEMLRKMLKRMKYAHSFLLFLSMVLAVIFSAGASQAQTPATQISTAFCAPPILRARVNFWIDVFTKYGEHQKIVHHRLYPQIIFGILDFSAEAQTMNPIELRKFKDAEEKQAIERVKTALRRLGAGESPSNPVERHIASAMAGLRGGSDKYLDVLNNDLVRTQTGIKEKTVSAIERSGRYLHFIEDIFVNEYGLPKEITRLPLIESTFNYEAVSSAGAAGLWQFMTETGKGFGMRINRYVDERKDPIIASRAAAQYIKRAYDRLGSWPLAITSYNHGVTGVLRKMKEAGSNDLARVIESGSANPFGFASSNFWPEFLAAVEIYANHHHYLPGVELDAPLHLSERRLPSSMPVQAIIKQTGLSKDALRVANYALSDAIWQGRAPLPAGYVLRVPESYSRQLERASFRPTAEAPKVEHFVPSSSIYGGVSHTVRKGDTLLGIAKRYGTTVKALKSLNRLSGTKVIPGQVLAVKNPEKRPETAKWRRVESEGTEKQKNTISKASATPAAKSRQKAPSKKQHIVRKGDTLSSIANRYSVKIENLKKANKLTSSVVKLGQVLTIP